MNHNYVGMLLERDDGKLLFQLRDTIKIISHPNKWSLFGGGIEPGETPLNALLREIKEELGITLHKKRIHLLTRYTTPTTSRYVYYYSLQKNEETHLRLCEGQRYAFFRLHRILLTRNVVPSLRMFLLAYPYFKLRMKRKHH